MLRLMPVAGAIMTCDVLRARSSAWTCVVITRLALNTFEFGFGCTMQTHTLVVCQSPSLAVTPAVLGAQITQEWPRLSIQIDT